MKKILSVALTTVLLLSIFCLMGCSGKPKEEPMPSGTTYNNSTVPSGGHSKAKGVSGGGMKAD